MSGRFYWSYHNSPATMQASMQFDGNRNAKPYIREGYRGETVVDLPAHSAKEIIEWCKQIFGEPGRDRRYAWRYNCATGNRIFLRSPQQVTHFRLAWL